MAALSLLLAVIPAAAQQQHPNTATGFKPDSTYDVLGLDNVNMFNGNMVMQLPLGLRYANGGGSSVGLALHYNSSAWAFEQRKSEKPVEIAQVLAAQMITALGGAALPDLVILPDVWPTSWVPYMLAYPDRRNNAGMGWSVSLGQLFGVNDTALTNQEVFTTSVGTTMPNPPPPDCARSAVDCRPMMYVSPDNAEHVLHGTTTPGTYVTADGSHLRLRLFAPGLVEPYACAILDSPEGTHQTFEWYGSDPNKHFRLRKIKDAFGNTVTVDYGVNQWTITDAFGRTYKVLFEETEKDVLSHYRQPNYPAVVTEVDVPKFGSTTDVIKYQFSYELRNLQRDPTGAFVTGEEKDDARVLTSVTTVDGATTLQTVTFNYNAQGQLSFMGLPTGGHLEWDYGLYSTPTDECIHQWETFHMGVTARRVFDTNSGTMTWTWAPKLDRTLIGATFPNTLRCACDPLLNNISGNYQHFLSIEHAPLPLLVVTTTTPTGETTVHYFSVWPTAGDNCNPPPPEKVADFGLPYTRRFTDDSGKFFLSEETFDANKRRVRIKYVTYNDDDGMAYVGGSSGMEENNRRLESVKIVDLDPNGTVSGNGAQTTVPPASAVKATSTVVYSDYDSVSGHYRVSTAAGSGSLTRIATTHYTPNTTDWLLNLYDSVDAKQTDAAGALSPANGLSVTHELFKFEPSTGFLLAKRLLVNANATLNDKDVLAVFTHDAAGNLASEKWYGGDKGGAGTPADKFTPSGSPQYRTDYTYDHGVAATVTAKNADGSDFLLLSKSTIDPSTSLVSASVDPAGCTVSPCQWSVTYGYDGLGRITSVKPTQGASTQYTYINATPTSPAKVYADRKTFAVLNRTTYVYDSLGRLTQEILPAAKGGQATRLTVYDVFGRKSQVSELFGSGETPHTTVFSNFDAFGRPTTVTAPDGSVTTYAFTGDRITKRTVTPSAGTSFVTTEVRDAFGELVNVVEPSGPNGALLCTLYTYDAGGHLINVAPKDATCTTDSGTQKRTFTFDGRGFLTAQYVPEKGGAAAANVAYEYDAKGHVTSATDVDKKINNVFDAAERLTTVSAGSLVLKQFYYDSVPGDTTYPVMPGRLYESVRHNYTSAGDRPIKEFFRYNNINGTLSHKITDVGNGKTFEQSISVDSLGNVVQLNYPVCSACDTGAGPVRQITRSFTNGFLTDVNGFANIDYLANGMVTGVTHANGIADTYAPDSSGLARPSAISFRGVDSCNAPSNLSITADAVSIASGSVTQLHASATGSAPLTYKWYRVDAGSSSALLVGIGADLPTGPLSVSATFWFKVMNGCGSGETQSANLTITVSDSSQGCTSPPVITSPPLSQQIAPGASVPLSVGTNTVGCRFQWYAGSAGNTSSPVASGNTQQIRVSPGATTSYWVRVTNDCGSVDSAAATITVSGSNCSIPTPTVTASALQSFPSRPLTLSTATVDGATYAWEYWLFSQLGWHSMANSNSPTITVNPTVTTSYRVIVTSSCATPATSEAVNIFVKTPPVPYDFDGDGVPDVVWRDQSTSRLWITSGADMMAQRPLTTLLEYDVASIPDWRINAVGDFDGDYLPDIAWHQRATGDTVVWKFDGTQFATSQWRSLFMLDETMYDPAWQLEGAGQYTQTRTTDDLIYRNYRTGEIRIVPTSSFAGLTPITLPGDADLSWKIVAIGNIDNNGPVDFVWRQFGTGNVRIWLMGHVGDYGTDANGVRQIINLPAEPDLTWKIVEAAPFNSEDGYADILWVKTDSGAMRVWLANPANYASPGLMILPSIAGVNERVAGAGDFDACAPPAVTVSVSGPTGFCGSATLTASGGTSWLWSTNERTQSITVTKSGSYTVTASTAEGCSATASVTATVNAPPAATIGANGPLDITDGEQRVLTASSGSSWLWSTAETTQSITVTATGDYWVKVTDANGCSAQSATMHVTRHPVPPSNVVATVSSSGTLSVAVSYTPVAGKSYTYIVQRSAGIGAGTLVWLPFTNVSNPDTSAVSGTTYYYRVLSYDGLQTSIVSNVDIATAMRFTDDPIVVPTTKIKAVHITELRSAVNAVRVSAGLPAFTAWATDGAALTHKKPAAVDVNELRAALNEALDRLMLLYPSLARPLYVDPTLLPDFLIRAAHLQQLRDRVK